MPRILLEIMRLILRLNSLLRRFHPVHRDLPSSSRILWTNGIRPVSRSDELLYGDKMPIISLLDSVAKGRAPGFPTKDVFLVRYVVEESAPGLPASMVVVFLVRYVVKAPSLPASTVVVFLVWGLVEESAPGLHTVTTMIVVFLLRGVAEGSAPGLLVSVGTSLGTGVAKKGALGLPIFIAVELLSIIATADPLRGINEEGTASLPISWNVILPSIVAKESAVGIPISSVFFS